MFKCFTSFIKRSTLSPAYWHRLTQLLCQCHLEWKIAKILHLWRFFFFSERGKRLWWLIDWLNNGSLIISGNKRGFFLTTNKKRPINYTIFKADLWRKQSVRRRGESTPFFTETECHELLVTSDFCTPFLLLLLLLYFVPPLIFSRVLRNTLDSISQPIPVALLEAKREE